jgi:hypothetical protein
MIIKEVKVARYKTLILAIEVGWKVFEQVKVSRLPFHHRPNKSIE